MTTYWDGGEVKAAQVFFTQIIHHQLMDEPSDVYVSGFYPIFIFDFPDEKSPNHSHLGVQKGVVLREVTRIWRDDNSLLSSNRSPNNFLFFPYQQIEWVFNFLANTKRLALNDHPQELSRGIAAISEGKCSASNFAFIPWKVENAALIVGRPFIDNEKINAFEVHESTLSDQQRFFERRPLQTSYNKYTDSSDGGYKFWNGFEKFNNSQKNTIQPRKCNSCPISHPAFFEDIRLHTIVIP